jgi:hypothetical protein
MTLGKDELQAGWRIGAVPRDRVIIEIANRLIRFVGMTEDLPADIRVYPNSKGRGGLGFQGYFPLTESWLIISTWLAHGFTRINLSSCQPFDPVAVGNFLEKVFDAKIQAFWSSPL